MAPNKKMEPRKTKSKNKIRTCNLLEIKKNKRHGP